MNVQWTPSKLVLVTWVFLLVGEDDSGLSDRTRFDPSPEKSVCNFPRSVTLELMIVGIQGQI